MPVIRSLVIAFSTYSRIPTPRVDWSDENRRYTMCFFPLVGVVIGGALWLWLWVCERLELGPLLQGAIAAVLPLLVSGGVHMDGFMDTSDALASWQSREKRLEILKDSHVGAFAVMGCAGYLLVMAGLLSEAEAAQGPLLGCCFICSRALSAWTLTALRSARPGGMLDGFARTAQKRAVGWMSVLYLAICIFVWELLGGWPALVCLAVAAACTLYYRSMAYRAFGGVTGDLAGWFVQLTELCLLAVFIVGGKLA